MTSELNVSIFVTKSDIVRNCVIKILAFRHLYIPPNPEKNEKKNYKKIKKITGKQLKKRKTSDV